MRFVVQTPLPIDDDVAAIVAHVRAHRSAVVVAPPGSGKTTRVPPALTAIGRTILLQPRRVAARALARRIASERGWTIGNEIGWQIRFERRFSERTRLLVATEGILTARMQSDPLLSDFDVIVLDEFHERSIHADVALAMAKQAMEARPDLAVVVMSATIAASDVSQFLGGARVFEVGTRRFPVDVVYRPGVSVAGAVREQLRNPAGDILCFLPGMREIERAAAELANADALVLPLHGSLDVDAQERALAPSPRRKVILATNIAETSLTVEGITDVIDSGLHKVLRFDPDTAVDHLVAERIAGDSADQRAGRAGRTQPGRAIRLWDARDILRPHREPDIGRVDLAPSLLDIVAWGGDPRTFAWFERPDEERIEAGMELLTSLGAIDSGRLTPAGMTLRSLPLHPRLGRILIDAHGADEAVTIVAKLGGGGPPEERELASMSRKLLGDDYRQRIDDATLRRALLAGYPDRVAQRREPKSARVLLSSGTGATLAREIDDGNGEFLVVLDITGDLVRMARVVEREWLSPTRKEIVHELEGNRVQAIERSWYGAILLHEQRVAPEHAEAERILAEHAKPEEMLVRRVAFAQLDVDWPSLIAIAVAGKRSLDQVQIELPFPLRRKLDELAPLTIPLPSGRSARLEYRDDGSVLASAKLQELFGLAESPRLGPHRTPITFALLSPGGRPVQITQDLRGFWNGAYQEVRKELRGRYPKHPWPEDPWTAPATHRTKRR
ncbi:MAG TPA: ATP-dependent helicase C-terminal domain-containing protein [Thermoanaerobaculia bacterium]|nr:ATP-dependent helicase C-terminal domain-containing protein [Thermoanaerobaculia bacterium]